MRYLIAIVIFSVAILFLEDYVTLEREDIESAASSKTIESNSEDNFSLPLTADEVDLNLSNPVNSVSESNHADKFATVAEEQSASQTDIQTNPDFYLQHAPFETDTVADNETPTIPNFERKSWSELLQEINKVR